MFEVCPPGVVRVLGVVCVDVLKEALLRDGGVASELLSAAAVELVGHARPICH